jgi:hypothetical protein
VLNDREFCRLGRCAEFPPHHSPPRSGRWPIAAT